MLLFLIIVAMPSFVAAQVIINEIAWMGTPVEGVDPKQIWKYENTEFHARSDGPSTTHGHRGQR